jgi:N-acetylneuraminic acid mutarotase
MTGNQANGASAVISGKLYVAGGGDNVGNTIAKLRVYNPATNTWAAKASMPTARSSAAGAAAGGLLFVMGGAVSSGSPTNKVQAYTP